MAEDERLSALLTSPFQSLLNTNYAPTPSEIPQIQSLVNTTSPSLASLADRIAEARAALSLLESQYASLEGPVAQHKALLSPIRRLPDEVLVEIFGHCLPDRHLPVASINTAPLLLTRVCRGWRSIALAAPDLWHRLHIAVPYASTRDDHSAVTQLTVARTTQWLRRAGATSLSLALHWPARAHLPQAQWGTLRAFPELIHAFAPNLTELTLNLPDAVLAALLNDHHTPGGGPAWPALRSISLHLHSQPSTKRPPLPHGDDVSTYAVFSPAAAPRLERIVWDHVVDDPLLLPVAWENLRELAIVGSAMTPSCWLSPEDARRVLRRCRKLETLAIGLVYYEGPRQPRLWSEVRQSDEEWENALTADLTDDEIDEPPNLAQSDEADVTEGDPPAGFAGLDQIIAGIEQDMQPSEGPLATGMDPLETDITIAIDQPDDIAAILSTAASPAASNVSQLEPSPTPSPALSAASLLASTSPIPLAVSPPPLLPRSPQSLHHGTRPTHTLTLHNLTHLSLYDTKYDWDQPQFLYHPTAGALQLPKLEQLTYRAVYATDRELRPLVHLFSLEEEEEGTAGLTGLAMATVGCGTTDWAEFEAEEDSLDFKFAATTTAGRRTARRPPTTPSPLLACLRAQVGEVRITEFAIHAESMTQSLLLDCLALMPRLRTLRIVDRAKVLTSSSSSSTDDSGGVVGGLGDRRRVDSERESDGAWAEWADECEVAPRDSLLRALNGETRAVPRRLPQCTTTISTELSNGIQLSAKALGKQPARSLSPLVMGDGAGLRLLGQRRLLCPALTSVRVDRARFSEGAVARFVQVRTCGALLERGARERGRRVREMHSGSDGDGDDGRGGARYEGAREGQVESDVEWESSGGVLEALLERFEVGLARYKPERWMLEPATLSVVSPPAGSSSAGSTSESAVKAATTVVHTDSDSLSAVDGTVVTDITIPSSPSNGDDASQDELAVDRLGLAIAGLRIHDDGEGDDDGVDGGRSVSQGSSPSLDTTHARARRSVRALRRGDKTLAAESDGDMDEDDVNSDASSDAHEEDEGKGEKADASRVVDLGDTEGPRNVGEIATPLGAYLAETFGIAARVEYAVVRPLTPSPKNRARPAEGLVVWRADDAVMV